jgi:hypothetical protein
MKFKKIRATNKNNMKNILKLSFLFFISISYAQQPIFNLRDYAGENIADSYLRDFNNDLNGFEGTYVFQNSDTIFKIKLRKVEQAKTYRFYEDLLIGEIEYKIGNNTLLNTLNDFETNFPDQSKHKIDGNIILANHNKPVCTDCSTNELRLGLSISDTKYASTIYLKKLLINGSQALRATIITSGPITKREGQILPIPIIRNGDFIFIKQP